MPSGSDTSMSSAVILAGIRAIHLHESSLGMTPKKPKISPKSIDLPKNNGKWHQCFTIS